ncbi:hypothetical protein PAENIP36_10030 [Paenibacillus sp. P36]
MKDRKYLNYLIINYLIIFVPPLSMSLLFDINHYITNYYEEFIGYSVGITGLILVNILDLIVKNEVVNGLIFLLIKILILYPFYITIVIKWRKLKWITYLISTLTSLWGIVFGFFWMAASMQ